MRNQHARASKQSPAQLQSKLVAAVQRSRLLFALIESAAGEPADTNQTLALSQIGQELMSTAAADLDKLLAADVAGGMRHG